MDLQEALQIAKERSLDLVQVTEKVEPPVCKIIDFGKYVYSEEKKKRKSEKQSGGQLKHIRISFRISLHDLETKARMAQKFLEKGNKVRIEMPLRGRERALQEFAKGKMKRFLEILEETLPIIIERDLKREPRGFTIIVTSGK